MGHLLERGEKFDKDKEIVVIVGNLSFTNTNEPSIKIHGPTLLTLAPRRKDLVDAIVQGQGSVKVRRGSGEEKSSPLPPGAPPTTPDPVTGDWSWSRRKSQELLWSPNSTLIRSQRSDSGVKRDFLVSSDGTMMEFPSASKEEWQAGKVTGPRSSMRLIVEIAVCIKYCNKPLVECNSLLHRTSLRN